MSFDLKKIARNHLHELTPYSTARDDYQGVASSYLDANENPFNTGYNRYPDPSQQALKNLIAKIKVVDPENIILGNGSDEIVDWLMRAFCNPGDNIVVPQPTYGMYTVSAAINNVVVKAPPLNKSFDLDLNLITDNIDRNTKLIFICSPNNPTGNLLSEAGIISLLQSFNGLVVLDEAYIDFSETDGFLGMLKCYPNLFILQTFSKAWGLAGLRLGSGFASREIIDLLKKIKPPYNISTMTQEFAIQALSNENQKTIWVRTIVEERIKLEAALKQLKMVKKVHPSDSNFLLVELSDAQACYRYLLDKGIIVRDRSTMANCSNCLRVTVGAPSENSLLTNALKGYEKSLVY